MKTYVEMESQNLDESNTTKLSSQDSHKILSKRKKYGIKTLWISAAVQFDGLHSRLDILSNIQSIQRHNPNIFTY